MKSIELTEKHKSKLLEMCNTLFPDTKWHFWQSEIDNYPDGMLGYNQHAILGKHKTIQPSLEIHWFEFCMTHLCVKIYNLIDKYNNDLFINMLHGSILSFTHFKESGDFVAIHPVDYLYEELNKLK